MTEKFRLDNKLSLVTGGGKGIGFGVSKALAEAVADTVLVARNSEAR
jgi:NAD(P)-dependent dehydrogenase (short-subunit alcohol dehydrogenase family)